LLSGDLSLTELGDEVSYRTGRTITENVLPDTSAFRDTYLRTRGRNVSIYLTIEAFVWLSVSELLPLLSWTGMSPTSACLL
jgi:hypothetical protein